MNDPFKFISKIGLGTLTDTESQYIKSVLPYGEPPELEEVWSFMDAAWNECRCDPDVMDERITNFYNHPVWLLNGLFIEQHVGSLSHRREFCEYAASLQPKRVADYGGGYGTLARMIGARCPDADVHIVEPHPHASAVTLAQQTPNVRYVSELKGDYDMLIATDLFEHVPDPLAMVESTAKHLRLDGEYLIANSFWPVIACHLPTTFHFRYSWDKVLRAMNLHPSRRVAYGQSFKRIGPVLAAPARVLEKRSKRWFNFIERMPYQLRPITVRLIL